MYCIYRHVRLDDNSVFYIGIGDSKRPYSKKSRNKYWHNIVQKCGYRVEIVVSDITWEDACSWEKYLISIYGRFNKGNGRLVNMTDGGEGSLGCTPTLETREKLSRLYKGIKWDEARKQSFREKRKPVSEETRLKMSLCRKGHLHHNAKQVLNKATGDIYLTAKDAARSINMNYNTLLNMLRGVVNNKTEFEFIKN